MALTQKEKTDYKRKYNEDTYDRIGMYLKRGEKELWQEAAQNAGQTLSAYITQAVKDRIKHDQESGE